MLKKLFFRTIYVLAFLVTVVNTVFALNGSIHPDINDLPDGKFKASYASPDGKSRIDIYVVDCDLGTGVKGVYVNGDTRKNIYWQTDQTDVKVKWTSNKKVIIDNISLTAKTEVFDSRFSTAIFSEGLLRRSKKNVQKSNS
ncbi:MAG: hypothetical protein J5852_04970 [Clostridia bacterium]|nr:hypothetical protein [Clostridia bacterium]